MMRFIFGISISILILAFIVGLLVIKGYIRFNYPSKKQYPVRGIDISHHQEEINWDLLAQEDLDFIFIKATEGGDFVDPKFKENWENAIKEGYKVGAYHFYRLCKTGKEQAANIIQTVPKENDRLPVVLDLEFGGNCETNQSHEQIISQIQECLDDLETYYEQVPILYVTTEFYEKYVSQEFKKYPVWIRDVFSSPKLEDQREWRFWQFANRGHCKGIEGYVDSNVFYGTREEWEVFLGWRFVRSTYDRVIVILSLGEGSKHHEQRSVASEHITYCAPSFYSGCLDPSPGLRMTSSDVKE